MGKKKDKVEPIILQPDESALILGPKDVRLVLPAPESKDDVMPEHVIMLAMIAIMLQREDEDLYNLLDNRIEFLIAHTKEQEE